MEVSVKNEPDTPSGEAANQASPGLSSQLFGRSGNLSDKAEPPSALQIFRSRSYTGDALVSPCAFDVAPCFHSWLLVPVPRIICRCCANQSRARPRAGKR